MSTPETTYHRALVPLDGSPLAEAVLPFVSGLARPLGLEIALLRVVPMVTSEIVRSGTRDIILDQGERLREEAEAYLRGVAARLVADGFRVITTVRTGEAAPEIVAGGRTGLARLFFGSVADAVLRHAAVPVFIVRATEAQLATSAA
jgi:nucleotide-binding universal stress UspA family protein